MRTDRNGRKKAAGQKQQQPTTQTTLTMAKVFYLDPIEHLSGKIAKRHRTVYNYRSASGRKYTSVHGARSTSPTSSELVMRTKFSVCTSAARLRLQDPSHSAADLALFRAQKKYSTILGFLVARAYSKYDDSTQTVIWD